MTVHPRTHLYGRDVGERRRGASWSLWVVASLSLLSIGAECSPTERGCDYAGTCSSGELPACINFCVDWTPVEDAIDMDCSIDPCDSRVLSGEFILCPNPLSCVPVIDGLTGGIGPAGRCASQNLQLADACDPDTDVCSTGMFCKRFGDAGGCPEFERIPWVHPAGTQGMCVLPTREGGLCNGNWPGPGCSVCEPGTLCTADPNRGGQFRCQRRCEDDGDCPCPSGVLPEHTVTGLPDTTCQPHGFCGICISSRNTCEYRYPDPEMDTECDEHPSTPGCAEWIQDRPYSCCDPLADCSEITALTAGERGVFSVGSHVCCRDVSSPCSASSECCPGAVCNPTTAQCEACGGLGAEPPIDGACCDGLVLHPAEGVCGRPCPIPDGQPCTSCPGVSSTAVCTPYSYRCPPPTSALDDDCDGVDDDCDGRTDEDWSSESSCAGTDDDCGASTFQGVERCIDGGIVCDTSGGLCKFNFDTLVFTGDYGDCWWGDRNCSDGCAPAAFCLNTSCNPGAPPKCWEMSKAFPAGPECDGFDVEQTCTGIACWSPGDANTTGDACP